MTERTSAQSPYEPPFEMWKRELLAAGWLQRKATVWEAPNGALYRGPYRAWRVMKAAADLEYAERKLSEEPTHD